MSSMASVLLYYCVVIFFFLHDHLNSVRICSFKYAVILYNAIVTWQISIFYKDFVSLKLGNILVGKVCLKLYRVEVLRTKDIFLSERFVLSWILGKVEGGIAKYIINAMNFSSSLSIPAFQI